MLSRSLAPKEMTVVQRTLAEMRVFFAQQPEAAKQLLATGEWRPSDKLPAAQLAAMTIVANQLMNLDEVLNK